MKKAISAFLLIPALLSAQPPHPSVTLTWTYPAVSGITFIVYRRQCPCTSPTVPDWTKISTAPVVVKTFLDTAVGMGKVYEYTVAATDGVAESAKTVGVPVVISIDTVTGLSAVTN